MKLFGKAKEKIKSKKGSYLSLVFLMVCLAVVYYGYLSIVEHFDSIVDRKEITIDSIYRSGKSYVIKDTAGVEHFVDRDSWENVSVGEVVHVFEGQYGEQIETKKHNIGRDLFK